MESALRLKVKGFFAFTSYELCYGVLQEQVFQIYSHVDGTLDRPVALRRTISVKNATVTKKADLKNGVPFALRIEYDDKPINPAIQHKKGLKRQRISIDCQTADCSSQWFSALEKAARYHLDREERLALPGKCCETLNIPDDAVLNREMIVKQYRKMCLQLHPDRGGDPRAFADLNQAYNTLLSLQLEEDDKNSCTKQLIKIILIKGPNGVGLALSLMEDRVRGEVVVNEVFPGMLRHAYSDLTPIEVGDAIVSIGEDADCRIWPLSRVRARLSLARIPIGGAVIIIFERRVPIMSTPESEAVAASLVDELLGLPENEEGTRGGRRSSISAARISTGRRQSIASRRISILTAAAEDDPHADLERDLAPSLRSHRRASLLTSDMPYTHTSPDPELQQLSQQQDDTPHPEAYSPASDESEAASSPHEPSHPPFETSSYSAASQLFSSVDSPRDGVEESAVASYDAYFSSSKQRSGGGGSSSRNRAPVRWERDSEEGTSPSVVQARAEAQSLEAMVEAEEQLIDTLKVQLAESRMQEVHQSKRASLDASHFIEEIEVLTKQNESYRKMLDSKFVDDGQEVRLLSSRVLDLESHLARSEAERAVLETNLNNMRYSLRHNAGTKLDVKSAHHPHHAVGPVGDVLQMTGVRYDAAFAKAESIIGGLERVIKEGATRRLGKGTKAMALGRAVQSATKIPTKAKNKAGNLQ